MSGERQVEGVERVEGLPDSPEIHVLFDVAPVCAPGHLRGQTLG